MTNSLTVPAPTVPTRRTVTATAGIVVKMLLLGATALLVSIPGLRARTMPKWLGGTGIALAVTIALSGIGYLLLNTALAPAAYVSGVLLLVWVTAVALLRS